MAKEDISALDIDMNMTDICHVCDNLLTDQTLERHVKKGPEKDQVK